MKFFLSIALLILIVGQSQAQRDHSFYMTNGLSFQQTKDLRFTSTFRSGLGYNADLVYENQKDSVINRVAALFTFSTQGKSNISYSLNLNPELRYEHLRNWRFPNFYLGAYIDAGSLIAHRFGRWTSDTNISYTIWSSLGVAARYERPLNFKGRQLLWRTHCSLPLLAYVVRPAYSFPYTDNFLEQDQFNFEREGLAGNIIKGGKIKTVGGFTRLHFQTGLLLPTKNNKWALGFAYRLSLLQTNDLKPIYQFTHQLNFIVQLK